MAHIWVNGQWHDMNSESASSSSGQPNYVQPPANAQATKGKGKFDAMWQTVHFSVERKGKGKENNNESGKGKGKDDDNNAPNKGKGKKCKDKKDDDDTSSSTEGSVVLPIIRMPKKRKKRARSPSF
jgi:hypothetical protein